MVLSNEEILIKNDNFSRANGRPPKIKIGGSEIVLIDNQGHVLEVVKNKDGGLLLYCFVCQKKIVGYKKASLKLHTIDRITFVEAVPINDL